MLPLSRRIFCGAFIASTLPLVYGCVSYAEQSKRLSIGALFAGKIDDKGFMEAGWRGLERARVELGVRTTYIDSIAPKRELLAEALHRLASSGVDLVLAHGGQNNEACKEVAALFPEVKFVVTQGGVTGNNLSSYEILQEESAYLAGVMAAMTTKTGIVGHMSGIRVRPGLKGRAAFVAGVHATRPDVKVLTNFSGNQDDNALSRRVAKAQIDAGTDIIFTMLNAGRTGVTEMCRERGVYQIGNVSDWVQADPQVFLASAIADVSMAVFEAAQDAQAGRFNTSKIHKVGLNNPQAVRLVMSHEVSEIARQKVALAATGIQAGSIKVPESYDGAEFPNPA